MGLNAQACVERLGRTQAAQLQSPSLAFADGLGRAWLRVEGLRVALELPRTQSGIVRLEHRRGSYRPVAASASERERFLSTLPALRVLVVTLTEDRVPVVWAPGAESQDPSETASLQLAPRLQLFDAVMARRDGPDLLFHHLDRSTPPRVAAALRLALDQEDGRARLKGCGPGQLRALALARDLRPERVRDSRIEAQLRLALTRGGGELLGWSRLSPALLEVRWRAAAQQVRSEVDAELQIQSAGVCLSGQDRAFDLTALCSALRRERGGAHEQSPWH